MKVVKVDVFVPHYPQIAYSRLWRACCGDVEKVSFAMRKDPSAPWQIHSLAKVPPASHFPEFISKHLLSKKIWQ